MGKRALLEGQKRTLPYNVSVPLYSYFKYFKSHIKKIEKSQFTSYV